MSAQNEKTIAVPISIFLSLLTGYAKCDMRDVVVPVEVIADLFDLTERRIQDFVKEENMPKMARGEYSLYECVQWYIRKLRRDLDMLKNSGSGERYAEQLRGDRIKNLSLAQKLIRQSQLLVEAEAVSLAWGLESAAIRSSLRGLIPALANAIGNDMTVQQRQDIIRKEIENICKNISENLHIDIEDFTFDDEEKPAENEE